MKARTRLFSFALGCSLAVAAHAQTDFVNWESPHVHPLEITPSGTRLLAVNTADDRLEVFDLTTTFPSWIGSVHVGVDPVTVRALSDSRVWVVNHISDSISVVDLDAMALLDTIQTPDEPCDVVLRDFGGGQLHAFVSCAQPDLVQTYKVDGDSVRMLTAIDILGEDPKAMAISPDGNKVYVAIQTSGNKTTILNGGNLVLPNIVSDPAGPY
ncbi:MAG: beta-propeller fold lactonase family protein, partial [Planctomycetes bacterium]|nr:beta-propeller fold lactonase family protein [Planctomycetota bacterium]